MRYATEVFVGALLISGCNSVAMPESLRPANERMTMTVAARGVQIYECRPAHSGGYQWTFVAPEADLFDERGRSIGTHGAGPSWQADDGSRVVGAVKARVDSPAGAIPWLLVATRSAPSPGAFSGVTSIQRINTIGGTAPATGCDAAHSGATAHVPYSADYVLFKPAGGEADRVSRIEPPVMAGQ